MQNFVPWCLKFSVSIHQQGLGFLRISHGIPQIRSSPYRSVNRNSQLSV